VNRKCLPKGSCVVHNAAVFRVGLWGSDWTMRALTSSLERSTDGSLFEGVIGRCLRIEVGAWLEEVGL
jgi:hypothetical protein